MRELAAEMYPTKEHFKCEWEDSHPDMYPEFAPDPIVIACDSEATAIVAWWEPEGGPGGGFGLPQAMQLCADHAKAWTEDNADETFCPAVKFVRIDK